MVKSKRERTIGILLTASAGAIIMAALMTGCKNEAAQAGSRKTESGEIREPAGPVTAEITGTSSIKEANGMPVYGNWRTFTHQ